MKRFLITVVDGCRHGYDGPYLPLEAGIIIDSGKVFGAEILNRTVGEDVARMILFNMNRKDEGTLGRVSWKAQ